MGFTGLALGAMYKAHGTASRGRCGIGLQIQPDGAALAPKAKSVVWLFMNGGVSQAESFDPEAGADQVRWQVDQS